MRIAVIGAGRMGTLHARSLVGLSEVEQVFIADEDQRRADGLAVQLGCLSLDSIDSVWASRPDGVVVASPNATHAALVNAALDAQIGVLCEKPLTLFYRESAQIAERARAADTPVMVALNRRFDTSFQAFRAQVAEGQYGTSYLLRVRHADIGPPRPGYLLRSGTMFLDQCIHDFDTVRWIAGCDVEAVSATGTQVLEDAPEFARQGDVDTSVSVLQLANGSIGVVEAFRHAPSGYEASVDIVGSLGMGASTGIRAPTFLDRFANAYRREMDAFVSLLGGRSENPCRAEDGTKALRIGLAAERAFKEGRSVPVDEIV